MRPSEMLKVPAHLKELFFHINVSDEKRLSFIFSSLRVELNRALCPKVSSILSDEAVLRETTHNPVTELCVT